MMIINQEIKEKPQRIKLGKLKMKNLKKLVYLALKLEDLKELKAYVVTEKIDCPKGTNARYKDWWLQIVNEKVDIIKEEEIIDFYLERQEEEKKYRKPRTQERLGLPETKNKLLTETNSYDTKEFKEYLRKNNLGYIARIKGTTYRFWKQASDALGFNWENTKAQIQKRIDAAIVGKQLETV